jgi:hypothetical protein
MHESARRDKNGLSEWPVQRIFQVFPQFAAGKTTFYLDFFAALPGAPAFFSLLKSTI